MSVYEPKNTHIIKEMYIFISQDENGLEGLVAAQFDSLFMPLIASDENRLNALIPIARSIAKETNKTIRLIKMTVREDMEVIGWLN